MADADTIVIYTDGACSGNPGPGGWCAILLWGGHRKELSGGEADTTNNRMELMAAISALEALKRASKVELHTDPHSADAGKSQQSAKAKEGEHKVRTKTMKGVNPDYKSEVLEFEVVVWRCSWSMAGNVLAVSGGDNRVSLWKEKLRGGWECVKTIEE